MSLKLELPGVHSRSGNRDYSLRFLAFLYEFPSLPLPTPPPASLWLLSSVGQSCLETTSAVPYCNHPAVFNHKPTSYMILKYSFNTQERTKKLPLNVCRHTDKPCRVGYARTNVNSYRTSYVVASVSSSVH